MTLGEWAALALPALSAIGAATWKLSARLTVLDVKIADVGVAVARHAQGPERLARVEATLLALDERVERNEEHLAQVHELDKRVGILTSRMRRQ